MSDTLFTDSLFTLKNLYDQKLDKIESLESQIRTLTEQKEQSEKCLNMFCNLIISAKWYQADSIRLDDIDIQLIKDTKSILNM